MLHTTVSTSPALSLPRIWQLSRNPLPFFTKLAAEQGDFADFRIRGRHFVLLNHPDYVQALLVQHNKKLSKGRLLQQSRQLLGNGLLTSEGDLHLKQRRLIQPAFHRKKVAEFATTMSEQSVALSARWQADEPVDMLAEMRELLLPIVAKTLFDSDIGYCDNFGGLV